jgi:hypothetical protein
MALLIDEEEQVEAAVLLINGRRFTEYGVRFDFEARQNAVAEKDREDRRVAMAKHAKIAILAVKDLLNFKIIEKR